MIAQLTTHLWHSTFFAIAVGLLTLVFRRNRAQVRYWLWLSASLKFFLPFSLLMSLGSQIHWAPAADRIAADIADQLTTPVVSYTIEQFSQPLLSARTAVPTAIDWTLIIGLVWLSGFVAIALMRSRSWLRIRAAIRTSIATNISAPVEVRSSSGLLEPGVVGLFRPILLLPEGIVEHLAPSELKAVLAHELCHIRRRDNLLATLHMIVEAVFWFHPVVWWIGARLLEERERACDEEVIRQGNHPDVYADAILNVCKLYTESPLTCVSGVTGASIRRRVEAIMMNRATHALTRAKKTLLAGLGTAALVGPVAVGMILGLGHAPAIHAQPTPAVRTSPSESPVQVAQTQPVPRQSPTLVPDKTRFDVVSIKPCMPGDGAPAVPGGRGGGAAGSFSPSPGRLNIACMSVSRLVDIAYVGYGNNPLLNNFGDNEPVRGGPRWARTDRFTIEAQTDNPVANGPTSPGRTPADRIMMGPMLQAVLENRFQLKSHRETEEIPMYSLIVGRNGLKIKPLEDDGCVRLDPTQDHHASDFAGPKPVCNTNIGPRNDQHVTGRLSWFAQTLSGILNRSVVDKTGTTDLFSIHLEFAPDENTPGRGGAVARGDPNSDLPPGPSIFTAIEQLGLKLDPINGPRGYIVIDRAERPSEN